MSFPSLKLILFMQNLRTVACHLILSLIVVYIYIYIYNESSGVSLNNLLCHFRSFILRNNR